MKLSAALIVKNESVLLERCLKSLSGFDEIIVVDTGSEDNTVEIAKRFTDKVFTDYKWESHFANARNHAMKKCTGDWIFTIDADDWLAQSGIEKLRAIIEEHPNEYAFYVQYKKENGTNSHKLPCLYKNCPEVYWKGAAHNHLSVLATIDSGAITVYGYSPAHKKDPDRTFRILKKAVENDRTKPREMFYLAREYRYKADWISCLYWCIEYLKIGSWGPEVADAWLMKARSLWHLQRGEEARDACLQAIKINTHFKEAVLLMAEMSGPINKDMWVLMAEFADNRKILFTREKAEKPAAYYEKINDKGARYTNIYNMVGKIIGKRSMLDIGCGQGNLSGYVENYDGFDMIKNPHRIADIYAHEFGDYDVYVLLEVLEHLTRDIEVLRKIPAGKDIVFSVPSFDDPSHVRMFTETIIRWRYRDVIRIQNITRFDFDDKVRKWKSDFPATPSYIMLCKGRRI
ncbi:MAG: glycosyltransferase [Candidatus Marinimicrobia bacterium]|nr:glycosyltransferase [Candidatus Neomarinimicrobiota bacterium]